MNFKIFYKATLLLFMLINSFNTSAQKYKRLFLENDFEKLSEKVEKAYKKDTSDILVVYYRSKLCVNFAPQNLDLAYNLINRVCEGYPPNINEKLNEKYQEEDLTYLNALQFKENVCKLILDSIEKPTNSLLSNYKNFIKKYNCNLNKGVIYKIDSLEFMELLKDSSILRCELYLKDNQSTAFEKEILSIIEFKTFQELAVTNPNEESCNSFLTRFPNSIFKPDVKYYLLKIKLERKLALNDTNVINSFFLEANEFENKVTKQTALDLIQKNKELIYYSLIEKSKDIQTINSFIINYPNSVNINRVIELRDSIIKIDNQQNIKERFDYEYPEYITKKGFVDFYSSSLITSVDYENAKRFKNGYARISRSNNLIYDGKEKWTFINKNGKIITDFVFDEAYDFTENLAAVKKDGLWGFIDTSGNQVIDFKYQSVKNFKHGFAVVANFTGANYYIDEKGNQYGDGYFIAFPFCNNKRAIIKESNNGSYHIIDRNFNKIQEFGGGDMYDVSNKLTFVSGINLVDSNNNSVNWKLNITHKYNCYGENIISFPYTDKKMIDAFPLNNNDYFLIGTVFNYCGDGWIYTRGETPIYACIFNNEGKKIIDNDLMISPKDIKIKNNFIYIKRETENYDKSLGGYEVVYDLKNSRIFNDKKYYSYGEFSDGFCVVTKSSSNGYYDEGLKFGFIDVNGKLLGNTINYDQVTSFKNGFAIVNQNEKSGIINTKSELIGNRVWDNADFFSRNHFLCRKDNKFVIVDTNGVEVSQLFDNVGQLSEGYASVLTGGKLGFINDKGVIVVKPFQFDEVRSFHNGLAPVRFQGKWGFIDISGKFIITPQYLEFNQFMIKEGFALVRGNDKIDKNSGWGSPNYFIIDRSGKKIKEIKYER
jgi:hypothetical protein